MRKSEKIRGQFGLDFKKRFVIDILMLLALVNGITCNAGQTQVNGLKISEIKWAEDPKEFQNLMSSGTPDRSLSRGKSLAVAVFDKVFQWIFNSDPEEGDPSRGQRSFGFGQRFVGHRKRLQFALLPIMYKMGVMTTLLTGLTVFALKGLTIGLILLMFSLGNHFMKNKQWNTSSGQPIHVHVHSGEKGEKYGKYYEHGEKYVSSPWDREEIQEKYSKPNVEDDWDSYRNKYYHGSSENTKFSPIVHN